MYVTAHRVRQQPTGASGINAFLHLHDDRSDLNWSPPDVARVAELDPGRAVRESCDIEPGGNTVMSFVDVAAADGSSRAAIESAIREYRKRLASAPDATATPAVYDEVGVRFGAVGGLADAVLREYDALVERLLELL